MSTELAFPDMASTETLKTKRIEDQVMINFADFDNEAYGRWDKAGDIVYRHWLPSVHRPINKLTTGQLSYHYVPFDTFCHHTSFDAGSLILNEGMKCYPVVRNSVVKNHCHPIHGRPVCWFGPGICASAVNPFCYRERYGNVVFTMTENLLARHRNPDLKFYFIEVITYLKRAASRILVSRGRLHGLREYEPEVLGGPWYILNGQHYVLQHVDDMVPHTLELMVDEGCFTDHNLQVSFVGCKCPPRDLVVKHQGGWDEVTFGTLYIIYLAALYKWPGGHVTYDLTAKTKLCKYVEQEVPKLKTRNQTVPHQLPAGSVNTGVNATIQPHGPNLIVKQLKEMQIPPNGGLQKAFFKVLDKAEDNNVEVKREVTLHLFRVVNQLWLNKNPNIWQVAKAFLDRRWLCVSLEASGGRQLDIVWAQIVLFLSCIKENRAKEFALEVLSHQVGTCDHMGEEIITKIKQLFDKQYSL